MVQNSLRGWKYEAIKIKELLSQSIGIINSYYRPTENELLNDDLQV